MTKFKIEIIIPERIFLETEIDSLTVETTKGKLGILAKHAPMVIGLKPGIMVMKKDGEIMAALNGDGFVEAQPEKVIILCQTIEWQNADKPVT